MEKAKADKRSRVAVRDICYIGLFVALIAVLAQVQVPMPAGVPMTLQTLIIPLAGVILGSKRGTIATVVYVLLGAVGAPVFAGFSGGIGIVLGVTGGFIVSFPLMAFLAGFGYEKNAKFGIWIGLVTGALLNYLVGTVWFAVFTGSTLMDGFIACVLPFIPTAIIKIALAGIAGPMLRKVLVRAGLL